MWVGASTGMALGVDLGAAGAAGAGGGGIGVMVAAECGEEVEEEEPAPREPGKPPVRPAAAAACSAACACAAESAAAAWPPPPPPLLPPPPPPLLREDEEFCNKRLERVFFFLVSPTSRLNVMFACLVRLCRGGRVRSRHRQHLDLIQVEICHVHLGSFCCFSFLAS